MSSLVRHVASQQAPGCGLCAAANLTDKKFQDEPDEESGYVPLRPGRSALLLVDSKKEVSSTFWTQVLNSKASHTWW